MRRLFISFVTLIVVSIGLKVQAVTNDSAPPLREKLVIQGRILDKFALDNNTNPVWIWITKGVRSAE